MTPESIINRYRRCLARLVRDFVVRRYVAAGLLWGDAESYSGYLGECVGYAGMLRKLTRWEARYVRLGFKPVVWVEAGGYGKDYSSKLYLPNNQTSGPLGPLRRGVLVTTRLSEIGKSRQT